MKKHQKVPRSHVVSSTPARKPKIKVQSKRKALLASMSPESRRACKNIDKKYLPAFIALGRRNGLTKKETLEILAKTFSTVPKHPNAHELEVRLKEVMTEKILSKRSVVYVKDP